MHYVSCGRGKDENASPCLQHTQVPKQVCCQKHPVHDERRRLLATRPGGSGHGTRGRTSSCHVFLVLRNNEGKACSQIQAGNTFYCLLGIPSMMHLSKWGAPEFTLHLLAGCGATFFHDSVMTPAEVNEHFVRQILALYSRLWPESFYNATQCNAR